MYRLIVRSKATRAMIAMFESDILEKLLDIARDNIHNGFMIEIYEV
jgi:hypothetical protein